MAKGFDDDVLGAVLECGVLRTKGNPTLRAEWEKKSIKAAARGAFQMPADVWTGPALELGPLESALAVGRNREDVKRRLARVFLTLERHLLIEAHAGDDNPRTLLRDVTALGTELFEEDAYREYVCGLPFVVERWKKSIVYVYGAEGIGTGFLVSPRLVITARHVLEELNFKFKVALGADDLSVATYRLPEKVDDLDLAVIELNQELQNVEPMRLSAHVELLDEVIVFGYPPVPQTREAYLLVNRGEVSAQVKLHSGCDAVLVTCLLRGGYSGGPVVNRRGQVIGVVSRNLFKELGTAEKSVNEGLGFAAAVPAISVEDLIANRV